jgi:AcrR family transcriptional regulator
MEEKQDVIITAAESQFIRFGFRKTTMEEIARAAGMSKATLYYYFKSKEDVFAAMVGKEAENGVKIVTTAVEAAPTVQEKLRTFVVAQAELMKAKLDYYAILREDLIDLLPLAKRKMDQLHACGHATVQAVLADGVTAGSFVCDDVDAAASLLLGLIRDFTTRVIIEENRATWQEDVARFVNLLLHGLETRTPVSA